jgi:glucose-6-phosphate isomerase
MKKFADYFQQGDMESNGKSVTKDGSRVNYETGVSPPSTLQNSDSQSSPSSGDRAVPTVNTLSTSSSTRVPSLFPGMSSLQLSRGILMSSDFLAPVQTLNPISGGKHHEILLSNFFAQPECAFPLPIRS